MMQHRVASLAALLFCKDKNGQWPLPTLHAVVHGLGASLFGAEQHRHCLADLISVTGGGCSSINICMTQQQTPAQQGTSSPRHLSSLTVVMYGLQAAWHHADDTNSCCDVIMMLQNIQHCLLLAACLHAMSKSKLDTLTSRPST
jgi:hypothetical protein